MEAARTSCPKCGSEAAQGSLECARCGVVFRKLRPRSTHDRGSPQGWVRRDSGGDREAGTPLSLQELLLPQQEDVNLLFWSGRLLIYLGFFVWSLWFVFSPMGSNYAGRSFLHNVNLLFHEAGHVLFRPFGHFMTTLGGTLMQLIMPALCLGTFLFKERNAFGASMALWWVGENLMDIAPYVNDARARELILLGGVTGRDVPGYHDWEVILGRLGILPADHAIALTIHGAGILLMLLALAWGGASLGLQFREWRRSA